MVDNGGVESIFFGVEAQARSRKRDGMIRNGTGTVVGAATTACSSKYRSRLRCWVNRGRGEEPSTSTTSHI